MKLRATETPSATPAPTLPPNDTDAATAATTASIVAVLVAVSPKLPILLAAVPRLLPSTYASTVVRMMFVDSEPPPASAKPTFPPAMPTETATATEVALIVAASVARRSTAPPPVRTLGTSTIDASIVLSIVLCASEKPIASAPPLPPVRLAATETACASAVMAAVLSAVTLTAPPVVVTVAASSPSIDASRIVAILLSVHRKPTLRPRPSPAEAAIATAVARTVASIVELSVAETVMPDAAFRVAASAYALTSTGSAPPYSSQPIRLRASEKPIATAGLLPVPTATETAVAATSAVIEPAYVVCTEMLPAGAVPVAVTPLPAIDAFAVPSIRLTAIAPPPEKAIELPRLAATPIAVAREIASIAGGLVGRDDHVAVRRARVRDVGDPRLHHRRDLVARDAHADADAGRVLRRRGDRDRGHLDLGAHAGVVGGGDGEVAVLRLEQRGVLDERLDVGPDAVHRHDGVDRDRVAVVRERRLDRDGGALDRRLDARGRVGGDRQRAAGRDARARDLRDRLHRLRGREVEPEDRVRDVEEHVLRLDADRVEREHDADRHAVRRCLARRSSR